MPCYTILILLTFGKYLTVLLKRLPILCAVWILCSVGAFGASLWTSWGLKILSWPYFYKLRFGSVYGVSSVGQPPLASLDSGVCVSGNPSFDFMGITKLELSCLLVFIHCVCVCVATWQVVIWFSTCTINQLFYNASSLSTGCWNLFIVYAPCSCSCFHNGQREPKYRDSGAGCRHNDFMLHAIVTYVSTWAGRREGVSNNNVYLPKLSFFTHHFNWLLASS